MKLGCCIRNLNNLDSTAQLDFDYAEVSVTDILIPMNNYRDWKKNKQVISKSNFPIEVANSFLNIKVVGRNLNYQVIGDYLKNTFERARDIGIEIIGFGSGYARDIPEGFPRKKAKIQLDKFLNMALEYAEKNNIIIGLEPLNKKETNLINSLDEAKKVIKKVNNPNLRLTADLYQINEEGEDIEKLNNVEEELAHIHVADRLRKCPGIKTPNLERLFKIFKKINYDSRISIECNWTDLEELKNSRDCLANYHKDTL